MHFSQLGVNYQSWLTGLLILAMGCFCSISVLTTTYFIQQKWHGKNRPNHHIK